MKISSGGSHQRSLYYLIKEENAVEEDLRRSFEDSPVFSLLPMP